LLHFFKLKAPYIIYNVVKNKTTLNHKYICIYNLLFFTTLYIMYGAFNLKK
jgi:hypothetical protein